VCEHAAADNGGGQGHVARSPHGPAKQIQHADRYRAAERHVRIGEGSGQRLALSAQRVGAVAWPFLLSLPAVHPMVTVPTMFHGRVAVLPVVAMVAAIQEVNSDSISADVCYEIPNQATSATVGARFGRAARAPRTTRSLNLNLIRRGSRRVE
jgi:hypothetical protein